MLKLLQFAGYLAGLILGELLTLMERLPLIGRILPTQLK